MLSTNDTVNDNSFKIESSMWKLAYVWDAVRSIVHMQIFYFHMCCSCDSAGQGFKAFSIDEQLLKMKFEQERIIAVME